MMADETELSALVALVRLDQMGPSRLRPLLDAMNAPDAFEMLRRGCATLPDIVAACWRSTGVNQSILAAWQTQARSLDPAAVLADQHGRGITLVPLGDRRYPERIAAEEQPPPLLFLRGDADAIRTPAVAVVGMRRATRYGCAVAHELGSELSSAGVAVVSGLAAGIDGSAHRGALEAGGTAPVAVVGCGPDVVYPRSNEAVWSAVAEVGVVISETPGGVRPARWRFPARNRLIAALSDMIVVVESMATGGSLITADLAVDRDRLLGAVPGSVRSPASVGTNGLLRLPGVVVVRDARDVLDAIGTAVGTRDPGRRSESVPISRSAAAGVLPSTDQAVLDELGYEPARLDDLVERTRLPFMDVALAVERLESSGVIQRDGPWLTRDGQVGEETAVLAPMVR